MQRVHKVCTYLLRMESAISGTDEHKCLECPSWQKLKSHVRGKQSCRLAAEQVMNIVQTGNPWAKANCVWPTRKIKK